MTRSRLLLSSILVLAFVTVIAAHARRASGVETAGAAVPTRSFEFTYQVRVPPSADSQGSTRLWIPLPQADAYQDVRSLHIDSPVWYAQDRETEYGNKFAMFKPTAEQSAAGFDVTLRFTAVRREHKVSLDAASPKNVSTSTPRDPSLQRLS